MRWPRVRLAGFDTGDFERNDLIVKKSHDPADRADEFYAAFAGPIHGLRKSDVLDDLRQLFGKARERRIDP